MLLNHAFYEGFAAGVEYMESNPRPRLVVSMDMIGDLAFSPSNAVLGVVSEVQVNHSISGNVNIHVIIACSGPANVPVRP